MDLKEIIELMQSDDYKDRFKAEYYQLKDRLKKLTALTVKYEAGTLDFEPAVSLGVLMNQKNIMEQYVRILEVRAEIEKIEL